ncbi:MAG: conjugal transfer protein, partial [Hafnia sp.]
MVKKTPFRLSILAFVTAVVFTPVWAENTGIYLSDLPSRPVSNLDNIPTRPANNYSVTDIQKAKRQLSATEMKDIDSLIKAARDNQNATADR